LKSFGIRFQHEGTKDTKSTKKKLKIDGRANAAHPAKFINPDFFVHFVPSWLNLHFKSVSHPVRFEPLSVRIFPDVADQKSPRFRADT
jgi:hypothetical protein